MEQTKRPVPYSMQALVKASQLNPAPNTSVTFECPKCAREMTAYRTVSGKLTGNCRCGVTIPRA